MASRVVSPDARRPGVSAPVAETVACKPLASSQTLPTEAVERLRDTVARLDSLAALTARGVLGDATWQPTEALAVEMVRLLDRCRGDVSLAAADAEGCAA